MPTVRSNKKISHLHLTFEPHSISLLNLSILPSPLLTQQVLRLSLSLSLHLFLSSVPCDGTENQANPRVDGLSASNNSLDTRGSLQAAVCGLLHACKHRYDFKQMLFSPRRAGRLLLLLLHRDPRGFETGSYFPRAMSSRLDDFAGRAHALLIQCTDWRTHAGRQAGRHARTHVRTHYEPGPAVYHADRPPRAQ